MPDVGLTAVGSAAERVHELLADGRFVLLDLTGDDPALNSGIEAEWGGRVRPVTVTAHDDHPELADVSKLLVRPDGHMAWAARHGDDSRPGTHRAALADWAGAPDRGGKRHKGC